MAKAIKRNPVKLEYDPDSDAAYIRLKIGKVAESRPVGPGLILDYDKNEQVLGVEILGCSYRFERSKQLHRRVTS